MAEPGAGRVHVSEISQTPDISRCRLYKPPGRQGVPRAEETEVGGFAVRAKITVSSKLEGLCDRKAL
jgi:hypothetical protein